MFTHDDGDDRSDDVGRDGMELLLNDALVGVNRSDNGL